MGNTGDHAWSLSWCAWCYQDGGFNFWEKTVKKIFAAEAVCSVSQPHLHQQHPLFCPLYSSAHWSNIGRGGSNSKQWSLLLMHDSFFILSPDPWPMLSERIIIRTICLKVEISDFCIWRDGEMNNSELFCVAFELHVKGKVKAVISEHERSMWVSALWNLSCWISFWPSSQRRRCSYSDVSLALKFTFSSHFVCIFLCISLCNHCWLSCCPSLKAEIFKLHSIHFMSSSVFYLFLCSCN